MIHIVNGDVPGERLRDCAPLKGEVFVWREMYDFGPFSPQWEEGVSLEDRAAFFEDRIGIPAEQLEMVTRYQEQRLERIPESSRVVLWFEPDRYDQMMLIYLLKRMDRLGLENVDWVDLPEGKSLSNEDLVRLYEDRLPLEKRHMEQAVSAWNAYISTDPRDVERWLETEDNHLPYLFASFRRHLDYFPSAENGLNRVEELAMNRIREQAPTFGELFREVSRAREGDGLSDVHFAALLNELGDGPFPLIRTEKGDGEADGLEGRIFLTPLGEEVLSGSEDRVRASGIDWWLGGARLTRGHCWRRDDRGNLYLDTES
ncbi:uncharacterized protein DUF1835 [Melghirimyces profundicolus]|uniref:Uncharacterized protein DUF1835 n=1 Tax=Melghirimyces profundicolus TaxID=1242148 RepID=A0A2T6BXM2_9BACL|nr:DUF1835 domain-containing protein [Melghirimyces profundicolus]PTX60717.1 uncharacterized protein DUF1835 [Melghirimyces profundicolus]